MQGQSGSLTASNAPGDGTRRHTSSPPNRRLLSIVQEGRGECASTCATPWENVSNLFSSAFPCQLCFSFQGQISRRRQRCKAGRLRSNNLQCRIHRRQVTHPPIPLVAGRRREPTYRENWRMYYKWTAGTMATKRHKRRKNIQLLC